MRKALIGITGYAQHGKDTVGASLVERYGYRRLGFADKLKELALAVNPVIPIDETDMYSYACLADIVASFGWEIAKTNPEVRRFLQELGTQARLLLGEDVWVNALAKTLNESGVWTFESEWAAGYPDPPSRYSGPPVVIADVRFPNEADYVRSVGGLLIRVTRYNEDGTLYDNGLGTDHPSEKHVRDLPADFDAVGVSGQTEALTRQVHQYLLFPDEMESALD
jgi:hypothetical protein